MTRLFHVSSAANRDSILAHGLDWTRMGAAPGIAGSTAPEADGVFLSAGEFEVGFFVQMNNTGGPVDVWAVTAIEQRHLVEPGSGFSYYPARIPPDQIALVERPPDEAAPGTRRASEEDTAEQDTPSGSRRLRVAPGRRSVMRSSHQRRDDRVHPWPGAAGPFPREGQRCSTEQARRNRLPAPAAPAARAPG